MSGRDLVDEMRSGIRPMAEAPRRGGLLDIVIAAAAVVALGALGYVGYGTWFSGKGPRPPVQVAAVSAPAEPVVWTEADEAACNARGRAAAENPDTGSYLITNSSVSEGVAGLATRVECQLTKKPERFCGPEGNAALVAIVNDYINRMGLVRVGLAAQGAPMALLGGPLGGEVAAGDAMYQSMRGDTLDYMKQYDEKIATVVRSLGSRGLVKADDFKPFPFAGVPKSIEQLFAGVTVTSNVCA